MKLMVPALLCVVALGGCATVQRGSIPVVDASGSASELERDTDYASSGSGQPYGARPVAEPSADDAVVVMVPQQSAGAPLQVWSADSPQAPQPSFDMPSISQSPTGIPGGGLAADEQLDGPVLALLTAAQQQQAGGDLNGASSSLERAQRIAPREPQVLYRLAEVRLAQGDAVQAEQFARRGLSYAAGRPALQASLWDLIAQSRERMGDAAGAAQARQNARVNL